MSSLGEIFVTIRAVNETAATYADVRSSAALMASAVSGSPIALHVENLASPEINSIAEDASRVKSEVEASPITIEFEPITVPSIPPIPTVTIQVENLASREIGRVAEDAVSVKAGIEASPIIISFAPIEVPSIPPIEVPPITVPPIDIPPIEAPIIPPINTSEISRVAEEVEVVNAQVKASLITITFAPIEVPPIPAIEVPPIETNFALVELPIIPPIESPTVTVNFAPIEVPSIPPIEPPTISPIIIPPLDISEITAQFEAVSSDAAQIASTVSGSPITLNVENLASLEISRVRADAAGVKAEIEASPIMIAFEPVTVPFIPPIEVPFIEAHFGPIEPPILPPIENPIVTLNFAPIEVPPIPPIEPPVIPPITVPLVDTTPIQASLNDVGAAATEMGDNVRASASSFDEMEAHAEATTVSLRTVAGGIRTFSMMGMELTTVATDFGILDRETAKYMRGLMAVVMIVSTAARMYSFLTLMTSGHTAAVAIGTTTETASTGASIASTIATNVKTAATWIATAAQNALNISHATFLALTGVGIAVIIAAAVAIAYFASQMNAATNSVKGYNAAAAEMPERTQGMTRAGQQAMIRRGVE